MEKMKKEKKKKTKPKENTIRKDDPRPDAKTAASSSERLSQAAHIWRQVDQQGVAQQGVSTEPT